MKINHKIVASVAALVGIAGAAVLVPAVSAHLEHRKAEQICQKYEDQQVKVLTRAMEMIKEQEEAFEAGLTALDEGRYGAFKAQTSKVTGITSKHKQTMDRAYDLKASYLDECKFEDRKFEFFNTTVRNITAW